MFGFLPKPPLSKKVSLILTSITMLEEKTKPCILTDQKNRHSFWRVAKRLDLPELFVKLPKRDGLTKYRITSASARTEEETEELLGKLAYRESLFSTLWHNGRPC